VILGPLRGGVRPSSRRPLIHRPSGALNLPCFRHSPACLRLGRGEAGDIPFAKHMHVEGGAVLTPAEEISLGLCARLPNLRAKAKNHRRALVIEVVSSGKRRESERQHGPPRKTILPDSSSSAAPASESDRPKGRQTISRTTTWAAPRDAPPQAARAAAASLFKDECAKLGSRSVPCRRDGGAPSLSRGPCLGSHPGEVRKNYRGSS